MKTTEVNRNESIKLVDKKTRHQEVLDVLKKHGDLFGLTNREIAEHMGQPINRITGRVNELVKKGDVIVVGSVRDTITNRTVTLFSAL